jgi:hypothetical protein
VERRDGNARLQFRMPTSISGNTNGSRLSRS